LIRFGGILSGKGARKLEGIAISLLSHRSAGPANQEDLEFPVEISKYCFKGEMAMVEKG
jgi:hypothetical protein